MRPEPLSGRDIVVTRAKAQADELIDALVSVGGNVVPLPLLEIREPSDDGVGLRRALESLEPEDWLVVLSPNGARGVMSRVRDRRCRLAVIGEGTAAVLDEAGWTPELIAAEASSEGLLDSFRSVEIETRVMIAQAEGGRTVLADGLRTRGVSVESVVAYRNVVPELESAMVERALQADLVIFASPSSVARYVERVGVQPVDAVCIGPVTSEAAIGAGFSVRTASEPSVSGLVSAVVDTLTLS